MEFYLEFLLTAVVSVLIVFLIGKIATIAASSDDDLDRSPDLQSDPLLHNPVAAAPAAIGVSSAEETLLRGETERAGELIEESAQFSSERWEVLPSNRIEVSDEQADIGFREENDGVEIKEASSDLVEDIEEKELVGLNEVIEEEKSGIFVEEGAAAINAVEEEEEEEEWEGIERSELEKLFGAATAYAGSADGSSALSKLSSDAQMKLYGLHKVATEGPCYETQPMALKVAARAKWHAWQRLGNMNPEVAMEQYISLLSETIPGWIGEKHKGNSEANDFLEAEVSKTEAFSDLKFPKHNQLALDLERTPGDSSDIKEESVNAGPEHFDQGFTQSFLVNLLSPTALGFLSFLR